MNVLGTLLGDGRGAGDHPRWRRRRHALVVAQLALAVALVIPAGLLIRSLWVAVSVDPGFDAAGVVKAQYQLPTTRYPRDFSRWPALDEIHGFNDRLLANVARIPGIQSVALAASHPLDPGFTNSFDIVGREDERGRWPEISVRFVSSDYFDTLEVDLLAGRAFEARDRTDTHPVAILNQTAAQRLFADQEAIGQSIRFWGAERRIVGIAEDERFAGLTEATPIAAYVPLPQAPSHAGVLLARAERGDPLLLAEALTAAIRDADPELAVHGVERLTETLSGTFGERRFAMRVLASMAGFTLLLALIGVHGLLSYAAARRTREMGIRTALGASGAEVTRLVLRTGLGLGTVGILLGVVLAMIGSRWLASLLYGITTLDPLTYLLVPILLLVLTLFASWLPARRAARVEVLEALRME